MSDQLTSAIARLHDSASQLNAITDQASQYVNAIEEYLNETCRAGVGASVAFNTHPDGHWEQRLGYLRHGKRYRIVVTSGDPEALDYDEVTPWSECPREIKIHALRHLDQLVLAIVESINRMITDATTSTDKARDLLESLRAREGTR